MGLGTEPEQVGPAPGPPEATVSVQIHQILGLLGDRVDYEGEPHPRAACEIRRRGAVLARRFVQALRSLIEVHEIRTRSASSRIWIINWEFID